MEYQVEYQVEFQYKAEKAVEHEVKSFGNLLDAVEFYLGEGASIFRELRLLPANQLLPIVLQQDGEKWSPEQVQKFHEQEGVL